MTPPSMFIDGSIEASEPLTLERTTFDLAALVREVCERMRDVFERAGITVRSELEPVHGEWDRGRIDQVVTNLLTNAVKYGKGSAIDVTVTRRTATAVLSVADHGIGIADDDQARIFQRFERAVPSRKFGGLGLGLWIVSQLVAEHGGKIAVASKLGEGATFTVTLPAPPTE